MALTSPLLPDLRNFVATTYWLNARHWDFQDSFLLITGNLRQFWFLCFLSKNKPSSRFYRSFRVADLPGIPFALCAGTSGLLILIIYCDQSEYEFRSRAKENLHIGMGVSLNKLLFYTWSRRCRVSHMWHNLFFVSGFGFCLHFIVWLPCSCSLKLQSENCLLNALSCAAAVAFGLKLLVISINHFEKGFHFGLTKFVYRLCGSFGILASPDRGCCPWNPLPPPPQTKTTAKTTRHDPSHASLTKIGLQLEPEGSFWDGEGDWIAAWIRFVCSFLFGRKVEQYGHLHCTLKLANRKYNSLIESLPKKKKNKWRNKRSVYKRIEAPRCSFDFPFKSTFPCWSFVV